MKKVEVTNNLLSSQSKSVMKLTTTCIKDEKYSSVAAVAPGGWCCHCHCTASSTIASN